MKSISFFFFCLFRTAPVAYGSPQARGQIRAIAAGLHQSHYYCQQFSSFSKHNITLYIDIQKKNFFFFFLGVNLWHTEFAGLGVASEL